MALYSHQIYYFHWYSWSLIDKVFIIIIRFLFQEMQPAKQIKVIREFQKQSAQMDMTVIIKNQPE